MSSYLPALDSLKQHRLPNWFNNAKFGIFIHWGLYSVPAWAPLSGEINEISTNHGWDTFFHNNPYAEWYLNSLRIKSSPTFEHHNATYGPNFLYDDFIPLFNQSITQWDPQSWVELFQKSGARYVVLTTKHHDGFTLWPSKFINPYRHDYHASRDIVGELSEAIKRRGLHMGLYYSGGLDWSFNTTPVLSQSNLYQTIVQTPEFVEYVSNHWRELIDRYQPSILWNDIGYPTNADLLDLFAYYYNRVEHGVINDRFGQTFTAHTQQSDGVVINPEGIHRDFITPEYSAFKDINPIKWESCRGIGYSFGYNQCEDASSYSSPEKLIYFLIDIVSKNGNLLLNVGPTANGEIPEIQRNCLEKMGEWLTVNGEAIFDTRPWVYAEGTANQSIPLRFTQKSDQSSSVVYAILLGTPESQEILLDKVIATENTHISLLESQVEIPWQRAEHGIRLMLNFTLPTSITHVFKLTNVVGAMPQQ